MKNIAKNILLINFYNKLNFELQIFLNNLTLNINEKSNESFHKR